MSEVCATFWGLVCEWVTPYGGKTVSDGPMAGRSYKVTQHGYIKGRGRCEESILCPVQTD